MMALSVLLVLCSLFAKGQNLAFRQRIDLANFSVCPLPATITMYGEDNAFQGYSGSLDSTTLVVLWGDGTSDTGKFEMTGYYNNFDYSFTHNYQLPGKFRVLIRPIEPTYTNFYYYGGWSDTLVQVYPNCIHAEGVVFYDSINNCQLDASEPKVKNTTIVVRDSIGSIAGVGFSDDNGEYKANIPSGMVDATARIGIGLANQKCSPNGYVFPTVNDTTIDFAVFCNSAIDLVAHHGISGVGAPGDTGKVSIRSRVRGCEAGAALVKLTVDSQLVIGSQISGPTPDSIVGQTIYWTVSFSSSVGTPKTTSLVYASFETITNTNATLLSKVYFTASIESGLVETATYNNVENWSLLVDGPYDPNNKTVSPQGLDDDGKITLEQNELTYTVNFQNTGTAPAKNVFIIDSLSQYFDIASLRVIESSDPMTTAYYDGPILRFDFENINLPDSASDPEGSKGWFIFSVNLKDSLPFGTQIMNNVDIYFDYNAPIRTNTTLNTIYDPPFVPEDLIVSISKENVTCMSNDNGSIDLTIISGNPPYSILWGNGSSATSFTDLSPGIYTVTVTDSASIVHTENVEVLENRIHDTPIIAPIQGPKKVQSWNTFNYTTSTTALSSFVWTADGGEIESSVANAANVLWHAGPIGTLFVTEANEHGCTAIDSFKVEIAFVGVEPIISEGFKIYPNPTDGVLVIELNALTGTEEVQIRDVHGRLIQSKRIDSGNTYLDLRNVAKGVYTVTVLNDSGTEHQRLIVR